MALGRSLIERHGLPAWPWPGNKIVVLHKGLLLRDPKIIHLVAEIDLGKRLALVQPLLDLFNLTKLDEAVPRSEPFETIAMWCPTCQPWARRLDERTWHDAVLEDDPV